MARGEYRDDDGGHEQPWYNRTPEVVGASLAALIAIGLLVLSGVWGVRQFSEPPQAPVHFVDPGFSSTPRTTTATTTSTITPTSPPETTEINDTTTTESSETETSETSDTQTSEPETTSSRPRRDDDEETTRTTRRTPRTNVTRTLNPFN
ncbi:hypothetical protein [Mycolicibacterium phlei]